MPGTPTPAIPSFTDGTVVHQADLNALASNLTNLYGSNLGGFFTQAPTVLVKQTTAQTVSNTTDTLVDFHSAVINNDNMWIPSVANQLVVQHAGVYWLYAQARWPPISVGGGTTFSNVLAQRILVNGTSLANTVAYVTAPILNGEAATQLGTIVSLAVNATVYLDVWHNAGASITLKTDAGSSFLSATFITGP